MHIVELFYFFFKCVFAFLLVFKSGDNIMKLFLVLVRGLRSMGSHGVVVMACAQCALCIVTVEIKISD